jgi:hypothetical protein
VRIQVDNILLAILALFAAYWHLRIWFKFHACMTLARRWIKLLVVVALLFVAGSESAFVAGISIDQANNLFGTSHGLLIAALMGLGMSDYAEKRNLIHDH